MLPYHDDKQTERPPIVTISLIVLNLVVWIFVQGAGNGIRFRESVCRYGVIPAELTGAAAPGAPIAIADRVACEAAGERRPWKVVTWMFVHSSWLHLVGNVWFLWLFGRNVEDAMTRIRFAFFYIVCGVAAVLLQIALIPTSTLPLVGASGAISGVMAAYLVLLPRVRMFTIVPYGFTMRSVALPAWVMLGYWVLLQVLTGVASSGQNGGVAVWAHLGGFAGGLAAVWFFRRAPSSAHDADPRQLVGR